MQWLDDLDDLVVAIVHVIERLRWPSLEIGFAAACGLVIVNRAHASDAWMSALTWIVLASLMLWVTSIGVRELGEAATSRRSVGSNA